MDGATFIQTYVPLWLTILQVYMTLLSNETKAENAIQDVLLKLQEQYAHPGGIASSKVYATRIACGKCVDTPRAPAQHLRNAGEPTELEVSLVTTTPQEGLIAQEQLTRIDNQTATLSEQQQEVWQPRQKMMLTNNEATQRMGLQEVTVRSMISRLRKEARKLLADVRE